MQLAILLAAQIVAPTASDASLPDRQDKIDLAIEYVGDPESARGRAFAALLESHFADVDMTNASDLRSGKADASSLDDADVIIADADLSGLLEPGFSKPLVAISGRGVMTMKSVGAKADWL